MGATGEGLSPWTSLGDFCPQSPGFVPLRKFLATPLAPLVAVAFSGNIVELINAVTPRQAGLVLRWVTVHGYTISVFNQATQANSSHHSMVRRNEHTGDGYGHNYRRETDIVMRNNRP